MKKKLKALILAVRIYSQDIGIEFGIEKCAMLIMKSRKQQMVEGIELPNQDKIKTLGEKETSKYLAILEADSIKQVEMKETNFKSISGKKKKLLETKLYNRNINKGINTWAASS